MVANVAKVVTVVAAVLKKIVATTVVLTADASAAVALVQK